MKVHAYLLCYNEEKIIKSVLNYYSQFCSQIFVMDNMSNDNSVAIANEFPNVTIIPWENDGYIDESLYVKMKSQTYKDYSREGGKFTTEVADWIISCDMDEILYHPNLLEVLKHYKEMGVTVPTITGLNVVGENEINPDVDIIQQYQFAQRSAGFDKRIVFDCNFDMAYSHGCHPTGPGFEYMKQSYKYKSSNQFPLALLHYKHIGNRFYEAGLKNSERLNPVNIKTDKDGNMTGPGWQYKAVAEGKAQKLSTQSAKRLFNDDGSINFNEFSPSTGEQGLKSTESHNMDSKAVDLLRDTAISLESSGDLYLKERINLMSLALKLRPGGQFIARKLKEYKAKGKL